MKIWCSSNMKSIVLQMWSIEYVQVPANESSAHSTTAAAPSAAEEDQTTVSKDSTRGTLSAFLFVHNYIPLLVPPLNM